MDWPVVPVLTGKRVTRAEASALVLSMAFDDGTSLTFEPTADETGVNVTEGFTEGEPVELLPPGATIRRTGWMHHPDVPSPWGIRFDLDNDRTIRVFRFNDRLQVTPRLSRAVRSELKVSSSSSFSSPSSTPLADFALRLAAIVVAVILSIVGEAIGVPDLALWGFGALAAIGVAVAIFFGFRGQRCANKGRNA